MGEKVFIGIAMHPKALNSLQKANIICQYDSVDDCVGAIIYTPPDTWIDSPQVNTLYAIGCHAHSEKFGRFAKAKGISITLAHSLWRTVAEHALSLAMSAARNIAAADADIRAGRWLDGESLKIIHSGLDFQGKTFGIIGLGQIGRELADLLRGFRMNVIYNDIEPLPQCEKQYGVKYYDLDALLSLSDYLAVLLPLNDNTRGKIGPREFDLMKHGCVLINVARGPIIQENALLGALADGRVAAAGLDVLWHEPLPMDHPLLKIPNVILSPHLGGSTYECDMVLVNGILNALKHS